MIPKLSSTRLIIFDFDGVFTNNKVMVNENGLETVVCNRADGLAIDWLNKYKNINKKTKFDFLILSQEKNSVVANRAIKLNISYINGASNKYETLKKYFNLSENKFRELLKKSIYLGNDLNDLRMMKEVNFSVSPSDAHYLIKQTADLVLSEKGGNGFVRKFIEIMFKLDDMNYEEVINFLN